MVVAFIGVFISCSGGVAQATETAAVTAYSVQTTQVATTETEPPVSTTTISNTTLQEAGTVTDIDGNVYHTVGIGNQVWMVENLKVTHYRNGDPIPDVTDGTRWSNITTGAFCNYNNDENNVTTYGRLYNWYAVNDTRNICPTGWHIPTDAELVTLETYLGGSSVAGGKMKEAGTTHWISPNTDATNESGFTALPAGCRLSNGGYLNITKDVHFWSATERNSSGAWTRYLSDDSSETFHHYGSKHYGFCVRCVKD
ncbi:MAG: fibrobacter succinogenes major paralogous domain-containing protein [Actinobacteria bacterium]|nr:fibrobacter succinogenes major paralogous domain-containing protein [Actinomycetota bacterium]